MFISMHSILGWASFCMNYGINAAWLWQLHTGLQATWILCISTLPPDSGSLISKLNAKFTFIWKEDFGQLSNSPVLIFFLSPCKMLLMMFLFQKWLGSSFPEDVCSWWLLMHWLQVFDTLPSVWIGIAWQYSSFRSSLLLVHTILPNVFLPVNFAFNMLWYSTPCGRDIPILNRLIGQKSLWCRMSHQWFGLFS